MAIFVALVTSGAAPVFAPRPFVEDLAQVRETLATKYANLEWAVFQREADLPKLLETERLKGATH
ncbi:MAG: hypothetical protein ABR961_09380 [Thermoanaerobaculaceae bacterium]